MSVTEDTAIPQSEIRQRFTYASQGEDALAACLSFFFREKLNDRPWLWCSSRTNCFYVQVGNTYRQSLKGDWIRLTVAEAAAAANFWLQSLSETDRAQLDPSAPLRPLRWGRRGFQVTDEVLEEVTILRIVPCRYN